MKLVIFVLLLGAGLSGLYLSWKLIEWLFTDNGDAEAGSPLIGDEDIAQSLGFSMYHNAGDIEE
jgi:hypothetical protein